LPSQKPETCGRRSALSLKPTAAFGLCVARRSRLGSGCQVPLERRMNLIQLVAHPGHFAVIPIQFDLKLTGTNQLDVQMLPYLAELAFDHRQNVIGRGTLSPSAFGTFGSALASRTPAQRGCLPFDHRSKIFKTQTRCIASELFCCPTKVRFRHASEATSQLTPGGAEMFTIARVARALAAKDDMNSDFPTHLQTLTPREAAGIVVTLVARQGRTIRDSRRRDV
jgi:hypothetical protein